MQQMKNDKNTLHQKEKWFPLARIEEILKQMLSTRKKIGFTGRNGYKTKQNAFLQISKWFPLAGIDEKGGK